MMMLRDHLLCSINLQATQKRLLAEKTFTVEKALINAGIAIEALHLIIVTRNR